MSALTTLLLKTTSISTALLAAGGIATLTFFDVPILQSQPASRSLPSTRWLFSRGSHVFPTAAFVSAAGFGVLASHALPVPVSQLAKAMAAEGLIRAIGARSGGYVLAGVLCLSIAPWTSLVMIPNNFALIRLNAEKNGARSKRSAELLDSSPGQGKRRTELESVNGKGEADQWTDLSGPQEKTPTESTNAEDEKVRDMLGLFGRQNLARAVLIGLGGVVGLGVALS